MSRLACLLRGVAVEDAERIGRAAGRTRAGRRLGCHVPIMRVRCDSSGVGCDSRHAICREWSPSFARDRDEVDTVRWSRRRGPRQGLAGALGIRRRLVSSASRQWTGRHVVEKLKPVDPGAFPPMVGDEDPAAGWLGKRLPGTKCPYVSDESRRTSPRGSQQRKTPARRSCRDRRPVRSRSRVPLRSRAR